jgi:hypothetical protein
MNKYAEIWVLPKTKGKASKLVDVYNDIDENTVFTNDEQMKFETLLENVFEDDALDAELYKTSDGRDAKIAIENRLIEILESHASAFEPEALEILKQITGKEQIKNEVENWNERWLRRSTMRSPNLKYNLLKKKAEPIATDIGINPRDMVKLVDTGIAEGEIGHVIKEDSQNPGNFIVEVEGTEYSFHPSHLEKLSNLKKTIRTSKSITTTNIIGQMEVNDSDIML